jgi:hypothetical protein
MLDKQKISRNPETDRYIQLADDFLVLAEKQLSAFITAPRARKRVGDGPKMSLAR